jgi:hypothetical protein
MGDVFLARRALPRHRSLASDERNIKVNGNEAVFTEEPYEVVSRLRHAAGSGECFVKALREHHHVSTLPDAPDFMGAVFLRAVFDDKIGVGRAERRWIGAGQTGSIAPLC